MTTQALIILVRLILPSSEASWPVASDTLSLSSMEGCGEWLSCCSEPGLDGWVDGSYDPPPSFDILSWHQSLLPLILFFHSPLWGGEVDAHHQHPPPGLILWPMGVLLPPPLLSQNLTLKDHLKMCRRPTEERIAIVWGYRSAENLLPHLWVSRKRCRIKGKRRRRSRSVLTWVSSIIAWSSK